MPDGTLLPLNFPPGVVKDYTNYASKGRYVDSNNVRFRGPLPEKIGGWTLDAAFSVVGVPRSLFVWRMLDSSDCIAIGTHSHLFVIYRGGLFDITPLRKTSTNVADPPFSVTNGSTTVTVTDASHGASDGDYVVIGSAAAVGGITPDGEYQITSTAANTYDITHSSAASSTTTGGGAATDIEYLIPTGNEAESRGVGWGAGTYGGETYGTARSGDIDLTTWSFSNWGEDLIATRRNGGTYLWDSSVGTGTRAAILSNAPVTAAMSLVSAEDRHVIAFGAYDGANDDPMLIAWSDQEDNNTWTTSSTNTAGTYRLTQGRKIVAALPSRGQTLIFTDTSLYSMIFRGPPFTFSFKLLATDLTIMGQQSIAENNGILYWFGDKNFYMYDGQVKILPSTVRRHVFDNLNNDHKQKTFVRLNRQHNEVLFAYCSGVNTEPDMIAGYNYALPGDNIWFPWIISRTVWHDAQMFKDNPFALDSNGNFYDHEIGVNDNESAMTAYIESGAFELQSDEDGVGADLMKVDKMIPDATATGDMKFTFYYSKYPQSTESSKGPFTITSSTGKLSFKAKGRQGRVRWESDGLSAKWTLGVPRLRAIRSSGR